MELEEQYDKIYRYCYYRLRNASRAEDITQETFLRYLECRSYKDTGRPLAFLYTVARNLCIDESRKKIPEPLPEELTGEDREGFPTGSFPTGRFPGEDFLLDCIMLKEALHELSEQERELVLLRYVNEVPVADLAKLYGKSRYAVYRETKKVLQKLERRMTNG